MGKSEDFYKIFFRQAVQFHTDREPPLELGNDRVVAADLHRGGHPEVLLDDTHEVAVEIPILDAVVVPVADKSISVNIFPVDKKFFQRMDLNNTLMLQAEPHYIDRL